MKILPLVLLALAGTLASAGSAVSDHNEGNLELLANDETTNTNWRRLQAEVPTCDGGIVGIQSSDVCCSLSCGSCGGTGCTGRDGGADACCGGGVRSSGRFCSVTGEAPCITGPAPTPEPTPAPTQPPTDEGAVPMCDGGIVGIQSSDVCCTSSCGSCGGSGCTGRDGGEDACCGGGVRASGRYCSVTGEAPCMTGPAPTPEPTPAPTPPPTEEVPMCDGGIVGIQSSDVCCSLSCGSCGGTGCTVRDGGADACCGGGVRASGRDCSVTGEAPCVVTSGVPPTPVPSSGATPTPVTVTVSYDTVCKMSLTEATTVPTTLGGSSLTVTSSPCEFDLSTIFDIFAFGEDELLETVAGTVIDATTAKFTLPALPTDTTTVTVVAGSTAGEIIVGDITLFDLASLLESPLASLSDTDGAVRSSVITDPPSDLQLDWDAASISADSVEIVLADSETFEDIAVLDEVPNTGSYLIPFTSLEEFDLDDSFVFFKIVGSTASLRRRLQDSGIDPIVFPEIVTTGQLEWIEDLEGNDSSTTLCGTAFADDYSRCQCFFAAEKVKEGRGVQLDMFDEEYRCPSTIACILKAPPGLITSRKAGYSYEDLRSSNLISGWKNDLACPFGSCEFDSAGDDRNLLSCQQDAFTAWVWDKTFGKIFSPACELHPNAEFCVRSDEATSGGINNGIGNQCCYDAAGNIRVDAVDGGGTVDRHESELGSLDDHAREDTLPFDWCCGGGTSIDFWLCQLYLEMRPVDAGDGYITTLPTCSAAPAGGDTVTLTLPFSVEVPDLSESSVDFGLLVDVSGSYGDDIENLKTLAADLVEALSTDTAGVDVVDNRLALGSFSDFPSSDTSPDSAYTELKPFGNCGEGTEEEVSACFEAERSSFVDAVNSLVLEGGGDEPESQTVALVSAADGWTWRDAALKILAITTDASFHVPGDGSAESYFSLDDVISACLAKNIKILALKAPGAGEEMDTIATETGGVVETTTSNSSDILEKILVGIEAVTYNKVDIEWACRDSDFELNAWEHTQSPSEGYEDVEGGAELDFSVTVSVPAGVTAGKRCVALVVADEVLIGGQEFIANADGTITATDIAAP
ncbi:unnamed protein product [Ectocarpus sp. CCAP 1310/34]|nr:unnamed protein product [Ectocarpus sp. CCAP 1310/34]